MTFMTKLDKNRFTGMADGRINYPDNYVEAMPLAQKCRYDGRVMGDVTINTRETDASAYVTKQKLKLQEKIRRRK